MNFIEIHITPIEEATVAILKILKSTFMLEEDEELIDIENIIDSLFDELKEELYVVIETPYVDKFYRDSYYTYFASKHRVYSKDCIRISFFEDEITPDHFRNNDLFDELQSKFLGYSILRPTIPNIFGRSIIAKNAFAENGYQICEYKSNILLNGIRLEVNGFPHSSQDGESIKCAETTIWAIMEYFGSKYPDYRPVAISTIIEALAKYSKKRMLPSAGLTVDQISYALKEFGFGTYIYSRSEAYENEIENILSIYVESGIPTIVALENDIIGHAIIAIGYKREENIEFSTQKKRVLNFNGIDLNYIDYSDVERDYIIQDDNVTPHIQIKLNNPTEHYDEEEYPEWKDCKVNSLVVPLYRKIYLEAEIAKILSLEIISDHNFGYNFGNDFVFRFFLTSSRSFKAHISSLKEIEDEIADNIITTKMPKFIWISELYSKENYGKNIADGLVVLDATEASEIKKNAILFTAYPNQCIFKIGEKFICLPKGFKTYFRFNNNLS
ncbi:hypothetical protein [Zobellia galactanivorans]|uniref:Uncharacterized protein n=1 Tax=Zobellia galactanivorans (strain DSM 12802 / CCUG 47099 / CIP 106680 / NCIMB 13871 / Dsij) TaxID=63186 RepID=G0LCD2_ZOBGA|nr:hypothetical protein [Zobellia galactanivorans]CAZ96843.1 Conserved hypothetical protein [Zobellia galactanivorans]